MPYLECRDFRRVFRHFTLDISFSVEEGELLCIIGPSGSGKSTLLNAIAGTDRSVAGQIILAGEDITAMDIRRRGIGMVFQDFSLFPSMDVGRNIRYGMRDVSPEEKERRTEELLEMVDLPGFGKRSVNELSGGEAQRVALARAVAAKPRMLLLDEPLSALDAPLRKKLRATIRQIHDETGITMIHVTHDREEAFAIADRIMIMRDGKAVAAGTPEQLYRHPQNLFTAFFTGEGTALPMPRQSSDKSENLMFFRPEDAVLGKAVPDEGYTVFEGAVPESCEYTGSGYLVRLSYKGRPVLVMADNRPDFSCADALHFSVRNDRMVLLDGESTKDPGLGIN